MKKPKQKYDQDIPYDDYKMAWVMENNKLDFESSNKWLYIAADKYNPRFAKVGITMGDLTSRSYCSGNPNLFIFCAFQCNHHTTKEQLKNIEKNTLKHLDNIFSDKNNISKRARHADSRYLSECYYDIEFDDFFYEVHEYLFYNHLKYFQTCGYQNEIGYDDGYAISWLFNDRLTKEEKEKYIYKILRI